jgi:lipopolysaccharide export system permease protein
MNRKIKENPQAISLTVFRYIMAESFFAFFISFLFFFFIFFVNQILLMAQEILTKHVPFYQVALLILFSLPSIISMSAPFASLVGTLMTVGRLTSDNEILVMLSSGLSYRNIFLPAITVGIVVSMISFFANDILLPAGTVQFARLWRRILVSTPALEIEPNSVKRFKDTVIVTGNVTGNAIDNLIILDRTNDGERRVIMADNAELIDSGNQGLSLDLNKAFVQSSKEIVREDYDYATADYLQYRVSQDDIIQSVSSISPREMSSRDVRSEIKKRTVDLNSRSNDRRKKVSIQGQTLEDILRAGPGASSWSRKANAAASFQREAQALASMKKDSGFLIYVIEYYKKFSLPFGAFSFVFLAVSLGLMAKKSGQTVGFIFGNIIAAIYWSMLFIGQTMGLRLGTPPFWSMWLPNILALSAGVLLAVIRIRK